MTPSRRTPAVLAQLVPTPAATATGVPAPAPPAEGLGGAPRALTTRFLDFWLLGGASIVVWLVMISLDGMRTNWAVGRQFENLAVTTLSLSLIVNYPHFLISYKLAYTRGHAFITRHWWQLIAVPLGLIGVFAVAYAYYDVPVESLALVTGASDAVSGWGVNAQVLSGPRLGDLLFTATFNLMIFTIGWHYTKQVFGCMMVYAHFDGYALTAMQRALTKWALLSVWGLSFVDNNIGGQWKAFAGFSYSSLDLPDIARPIAEAVVYAGFALVVYKVFYANYRTTGERPSLNLLAPFVALYLWWLPVTRQDEFYFLLTPLFHSLQYLAFVYKVEDTRLRGASHREARATALVIGTVLAGWLAFEFVPNTMDTRLGTFDAWGTSFFLIAAMLFINIHHYFIDNVVWRLKDPRVRAYLLG
jgi:hypothetical protein